MSKTTLIVSVLIAAIILAGGYFLFFQDNEGNTNTTNIVATNENVNTATNINTDANSNENTNTATLSDIDTSDWLTYENEEHGYSIKIPSEWTVEDVELIDNPNLSGDAKFVRFSSENNDRELELGIKKVDDSYLLTSRTYFFVTYNGKYVPGDPVTIHEREVPTTVVVVDSKIKAWYLGNESTIFPQVGDRVLYAEYSVIYPLSDNATYEQNFAATDLSSEIDVIEMIISTLKLT
ncbi:MAG: hypothetical protein WC505_06460 [Patescibacteria group bacterium]